MVNALKEKYDFEFLIVENSEYIEVVKSTNCKFHLYPANRFSFFERIILRALNRKLLKRSEALRKSKLVQLSMKYTNTFHGYLFHYIAIFLQLFFTENFLYRIYKKVISDVRYDEICNYIKLNPRALLIATNSVVKHEFVLFMNLSYLSNLKIDFINSFDNTTSRGFLPFRMFDKHLVWNQKMKNELKEIFYIKDSKIELIGTPQFDLLTEGGAKSLNVDDHLYNVVERKKFITYCAGHVALFPFEKDIVQNIVSVLTSKFKDLEIVVRLHPLDNHQLWHDRFINQSKIIFDIPWKQNETNPLLSVPNKYEYLRHGRLLSKSLIVLNLGSTTSLDACVLDKPVYNIYFEEFNKNGELDLMYQSEHYSPIMESGAAPGVKSTDELVKIITDLKLGIEEPTLSSKRKKLAETYCGFSYSENFITRFDSYISKLV